MKKHLQTLLIVPLLFISNEILGQENNREKEVERPANEERLSSETKQASSSNTKEHKNTPQKQQEGNNQLKSSENTSKDTGSKLPNDFPKYINTGNPEADQEDYANRKKQWIQENPERYEALFSQSEDNKGTVRKAPKKIKSSH